MPARKSGPGPEPAGAGEAVQTLVPDLERIRAHVAANGRGITRDEAILEELTKLLHAKVQDETRAGGEAAFCVRPDEPAAALRRRIDDLLAAAAAGRSGGSEAAPIALDDECLAFAVATLADRQLRGAARDVVGEAYESLIFPSLRGGQGQFFTPKNVARCIAEIVDVGDGARVIDPACGTGGFLLEVAGHARARGREVALHGVDKDALLARLAADSLRLQAGGAAVICANSLSPPEAEGAEARALLAPGTYDAVITNPPFGAKIPVSGEALLGRYALARRWTFDRKGGRWRSGEALRESVPPQILFVERCLELLKEGGRCGIVLPEGILGNQGTGYVRQWLLERADVLAVIDCPVETFMPHTTTKTAVIIFERRAAPRRPAVFMAVAERCGHDRRGTPIVDARGRPVDDFPKVIDAWRRHRAGQEASEGRA
ncbi:MAG: N-6 DNA methylase [Myxococcales bacterium]|nr:N-6 DNA methylase [Myxococcales bacterium]